jgi:lipopolysaccharide biosynthesis regulator YciM
MDTTSKFEESSRQNLRYLAETIYNHAAVSFTTTSYPIAMSNYSKYKEVLNYAYPSTDFKEKDIMFHLALANTFSKIAEEDSASAEMYIKKAKENYEKVLSLDSSNVSANYNIGIIYYNRGVDIVNNMDYSLDLEQLNQIQDQVIELFKKSLPYMKKAYDLDPQKKETLIGLQGIYYSLNDTPKSEAFKKELELLKESQNSNEAPEDVEMQE